MESRRSPGTLPRGRGVGLVWFSSWYVVSIDPGHRAQSPQSGSRWRPAFKWEPVLSLSSFILPLLMLLTHSMSITHRDILHPGSPTASLGERHQPLGHKVHYALYNAGSTKQSYQGNYDSGKYSFPPITLHPR